MRYKMEKGSSITSSARVEVLKPTTFIPRNDAEAILLECSEIARSAAVAAPGAHLPIFKRSELYLYHQMGRARYRRQDLKDFAKKWEDIASNWIPVKRAFRRFRTARQLVKTWSQICERKEIRLQYLVKEADMLHQQWIEDIDALSIMHELKDIERAAVATLTEKMYDFRTQIDWGCPCPNPDHPHLEGELWQQTLHS
ncbi:hypothetical protein BU24DRAFT_454869 [Aaosphaeria arxii CBS 175.79]|uniref:Uncharacterized protein n=1 Tax=Aaosphaeria arxii CBS 175.79 TaxID=1450172 RepID=A0A6A5XBR0_9PLEO|nr:uncharacterized protein BU24DRAFT_454869 [Aaosphaeria arxii CBS 175.79]KAF2010515.1 hypothetical protein BU24DRAFT_454869 [Aaosphaeria arxii CBS 175.79]